jgi:hypothetical protein
MTMIEIDGSQGGGGAQQRIAAPILAGPAELGVRA